MLCFALGVVPKSDFLSAIEFPDKSKHTKSKQNTMLQHYMFITTVLKGAMLFLVNATSNGNIP